MNGRIKSIDFIRSASIFGVVLIHTTTRTLEASKFDINGFSWTLFLNQIARFAVPLFFVISGFVLEISSRPESYWTFIKRRFSKIFFPYIFWSLIYYFLIYTNNHDSLFKVLISGNASYQLYFIPALLIFYLIFPFIHQILQKVPNRIVFAVFGILGISLLYRNYYIKAFDFGDHINTIILAFSYFIIGALSGRNKDFIDNLVKKLKLILLAPSIFLGLYVFFEGKSRYLLTGNYLSYYSQWRPSVFIYTILIGLALYYLFEYTKLRKSIIERFSKHSFFVYFIHVAVLEIIWKTFGQHAFNLVENNFLGKIIFDPLFFTTVVLVSFFAAYMVHKVNKLQKLVG